jgi:hypothetical protein
MSHSIALKGMAVSGKEIIVWRKWVTTAVCCYFVSLLLVGLALSPIPLLAMPIGNPMQALVAAVVIEVLVVALVIGLLPAHIAHKKGHNFFFWWFFGAMLWIVAFPAALLLKPTHQNEKKCPSCAEWVQREAHVCRHCSYSFDTQAAPPSRMHVSCV